MIDCLINKPNILDNSYVLTLAHTNNSSHSTFSFVKINGEKKIVKAKLMSPNDSDVIY